MQIPSVTIAIPTYNRGDKYLKESLDSSLGQTYSNIEILISDNCSTDNTPEVIGSYKDSRIRYFRQKRNLGQRGNMNFLLQQAKGDYFLMLHDDDSIDSDFIETCIKAAKYKKGTGLILTGSRVIDETGCLLREKENHADNMDIEDFILYWYKKKVHMFLSCSLFGTEALRQAGGFEEMYNRYDDVAAEFKCAAFYGRIDVKEVKASFREHPDSGTSNSDLISWCKSALALLDLACELAPSKKAHLINTGLRTSADRVYRYASCEETLKNRLKAYWTVYKSFEFKQIPTRNNISQLLHH